MAIGKIDHVLFKENLLNVGPYIHMIVYYQKAMPS